MPVGLLPATELLKAQDVVVTCHGPSWPAESDDEERLGMLANMLGSASLKWKRTRTVTNSLVPGGEKRQMVLEGRCFLVQNGDNTFQCKLLQFFKKNVYRLLFKYVCTRWTVCFKKKREPIKQKQHFDSIFVHFQFKIRTYQVLT